MHDGQLWHTDNMALRVWRQKNHEEKTIQDYIEVENWTRLHRILSLPTSKPMGTGEMSYRQKCLCHKQEDLRLISEAHKKPMLAHLKPNHSQSLKQMRDMERKPPWSLHATILECRGQQKHDLPTLKQDRSMEKVGGTNPTFDKDVGIWWLLRARRESDSRVGPWLLLSYPNPDKDPKCICRLY